MGTDEPPEGTFSAVSVGGDHACAIKVEGNVVCWGSSTRGVVEVPFEANTTSQSNGADSGEAKSESEATTSPTATPPPTLSASDATRRMVTAATIAAASDATHVAKKTQTSPSYTPEPGPKPTEDIWTPQEKLGPRNLLVGAFGNGGIVSGKYEYQDDTGNKIVLGDSCVLKINLGTPAQESIQATKGQSFWEYIQDKHQYVIFEGYDGGCTGDPAIGYGLYRVGRVGD